MVVADLKLTHNTGETNVASLAGGGSIFVIPFFQRPYKWKPAKLKQLEKDVLLLVDGTNEVHFLGAIIIHGLPSNPADPAAYELIDGQQRLTTLYIYTCAVIKTLIEANELREAAQLFRRYIIDTDSTFAGSSLKLQSSKEDQGAMNLMIQDLIASEKFAAELSGFEFHPLPQTAVMSRRVVTNYEHAKRFCRKQFSDEGIDRLRDIYKCMLQRISLVQIDVKDPTNGPRIFDSLNSSQEPMTIGDLVRNDVFAKTASIDPDKATQVEKNHWHPFYERFKIDDRNYFDEYFFPFGLIYNSNLKKSDVYSALKERWKGRDPEAVISELSEYQAAFLDLRTGANDSNHPKAVYEAFRRLYLMGAPSSVYPFAMRLSKAVASGEVQAAIAVEILDVLDSFLTRRAVCGHEPTGLHAVFKGLWKELGENIDANAVAKRIASHSTVAWPNQAEFEEKVQTRGIYGTSIARYVLMEYDASFGGDDVSTLTMWIEHVLPQSLTKEWDSFSSQQHAQMKDLFANLIPLSAQMNNALQNSAFAKKAEKFKELSAFASARNFADTYVQWTPEILTERGVLLAKWCSARWPHNAPEVDG